MPPESSFPIFRHEIIDPDPPGAHHDITLPADLTGNGLPDIIIGCKYGEANLFWYENPGWKRHDIAHAPELEAGGLVADINRNGRPDIVAGQQIGGSELYWFACPADPRTRWPRHLIEDRFEKYHDQAFGDIDGDGEPELLVLTQVHGLLLAYDIPPDPTTGPWHEHCRIIADNIAGHEGIVIADVNNSGQPCIIAGTNLYYRCGCHASDWRVEPIAPGMEQTRVAAADLDGDGWPDIVLCEGESDRGRLVWFAGPRWRPYMLAEDLFHPHTLEIADFDGDGQPDIMVAEMGLGRNDTPRVIIFFNRGERTFEPVVISEGIPTHEAKVCDINGNGRPDIVGKAYFPHKHVDVWLNEGMDMK